MKNDTTGENRPDSREFARSAKARDAVDHLLLGVADLDQGIAWVEKATGIKPVGGGSHPGLGTRNALISLGDRQYLEIIAPDPGQKTTGGRAVQLCQLPAPRLIQWAAATTDIQAVAQQARAAGYEIEGPTDGSRVRPDGRLLRWKTLTVRTELGEAIPFFIEWGSGVIHPSKDSPPGCRLLALEMEHPQPDRLRRVLGDLGIESTVKSGASFRLKAELKTATGNVELS